MHDTNELQLQMLLNRQKSFFDTGATLSVPFRLRMLQRLKKAVRANENALCKALYEDLGKSRHESFMSELGLLYQEIAYFQKRLPSLAAEHRVQTPLPLFPAQSYTKPTPYGTVLILGSWNYPALLTLQPLADALAAGNTCVMKPSEEAPRTAIVLHSMIRECFPAKYVAVVTGGEEVSQRLLRQEFDSIFCTGSPNVGRAVMRQAAERLIPVTLELGGKSPCIVDETADIPLAARRIVFGKFLNCGQTCVAPDYVVCHRGVRQSLVRALKKEICRQYGKQPLENPNYGRIVSQRQFDRLQALLNPSNIVYGGNVSKEMLQIEPTILDYVTWKDPVMQEEIFGPILPILVYDDLDALIPLLNTKPRPLAAYFFSQRKDTASRFMERIQCGGGCINDTVMHLANPNLPFGGVGESGMGTYHGAAGFYAFSHTKSIVERKRLDLPLRYQPSRKWKEPVMRLFLGG